MQAILRAFNKTPKIEVIDHHSNDVIGKKQSAHLDLCIESHFF